MGFKISQLPVASSVGTSDLLPIVQGGVTKQATGALVAALSGGGSSLPSQTGSSGKLLTTDGTTASWAAIPAAYITNAMLAGSIAASKLVGTDIAIVGTITAGTWTGTAIAIANGGTGQATAVNALTALLPSQTGQSGKVLGTNGTVAAWVTQSGAVTGIIGTANQVIASSPTGSVTLSLPQNIDTTSSPTFATATLSGTNSITLGTVSANNGQIILCRVGDSSTLTLGPSQNLLGLSIVGQLFAGQNSDDGNIAGGFSNTIQGVSSIGDATVEQVLLISSNDSSGPLGLIVEIDSVANMVNLQASVVGSGIAPIQLQPYGGFVGINLGESVTPSCPLQIIGQVSTTDTTGNSFTACDGTNTIAAYDAAGNTCNICDNSQALHASDGTNGVIIGNGSIAVNAFDGNSNTCYLCDGANAITATGNVSITGQLQLSNSATASVGVGSISHKLPIYNASGTLLGYIPIYSTIT